MAHRLHRALLLFVILSFLGALSIPPADASSIAQASRASGLRTAAVGTNWTQDRFDVSRDGFNPFETILGPQNVANLAPLWIVRNLPAPVKSPVAVVSGRVFLAVYTDVFAYDAATGAQRWDSTIDYETGASPAVVDRTVYACGIDSIWAYAAGTGATRWVAPIGQIPYTDPLVAGGSVFVAAYNHLRIDALDARTGEVLWAAPTPDRVEESLALSGHSVIGLDDADDLFALDAATGALLWRSRIGNRESADTPVVADGLVFVRTSRRLTAVDAATGQTRWTVRLDLSIYPTAPAAADGLLYVGSDSGGLTAYDAQTGEALWSTTIEGGAQSESTVANGVVYVGTTSGVDAFDAAAGQLLWSGPTDGPVATSPVVMNGVLYVDTAPLVSGSLYAFALPARTVSHDESVHGQPEPDAALGTTLDLELGFLPHRDAGRSHHLLADAERQPA